MIGIKVVGYMDKQISIYMPSQMPTQPTGNLLIHPYDQETIKLDIHQTKQLPTFITIHPAGCPENKPSIQETVYINRRLH